MYNSKIVSVNCYLKNGRKFLVLKDDKNCVYFVSAGLVSYALEHCIAVKNDKKEGK